jgi:hypothetical protein
MSAWTCNSIPEGVRRFFVLTTEQRSHRAKGQAGMLKLFLRDATAVQGPRLAHHLSPARRRTATRRGAFHR